MHKICLVLSFVLLVFSALPVHAEESVDTQYRQMVEQSKSMPAAFDFAKVRDLYTKTSFFSPYKTMVKHDFATFFDRQKAGDQSVIADVEKYTDDNFSMFEVHSRANVLYAKLNQPERTTYHIWALRGLMTALLSSGDGKSAQSAYKVVHMSEEYFVVRNVGPVTSQRLEDKAMAGKIFDVLRVKQKDGTEKDFWFDITNVFGKGIP